jgi:co-chaperonin GroES (HSP10)
MLVIKIHNIPEAINRDQAVKMSNGVFHTEKWKPTVYVQEGDTNIHVTAGAEEFLRSIEKEYILIRKSDIYKQL